MSQNRFMLDDGRWIDYGFDRPFGTFFLQLYDPRFERHGQGAPAKVAGYHPAEEKIEPLAGEYGPYPLDLANVDQVLDVWGLSEDQAAQIRKGMVEFG